MDAIREVKKSVATISIQIRGQNHTRRGWAEHINEAIMADFLLNNFDAIQNIKRHVIENKIHCAS